VLDVSCAEDTARLARRTDILCARREVIAIPAIEVDSRTDQGSQLRWVARSRIIEKPRRPSGDNRQ